MPADFRAIIARVRRHPDAFAFDRHGFGEELVRTATAAVRDRMDAETDPDGNPWPPLSPAYEAWKSAAFGGQPMAVLHGTMKTDEQLTGLYSITTAEVRQDYGTTEEARAEARYFQGGGGNQPARPFYAFNDVAFGALRAVCDRRFEEANR